MISITFALFLAVLFTKGISHDLFLESGVFLVSVKLIILSLKNGLQAKRMENELREIKGLLQRP